MIGLDIKIGSAPDSWGVWFPQDSLQTPWHRYLDEVAEAGYEWTELGPYGYLPTDISKLKVELDQRKLKVCGSALVAHLEKPDIWRELEEQINDLGKVLAALKSEYLVLIDECYSDLFTGELLHPKRLDDRAWNRLTATVNQAARVAKERFGLTLVVHPHAESHVEYEDQIERLLADTDPALVHLCLDTGHHAYRGGNSAAFMRKHHRRIPYLHIKSVDLEMQARVERDNIPFAKAVAMNMFCEPSIGAVDFIEFREVLREIDYRGFAIVEQDMYPVDFSKPLPIAKRSRNYLKQIHFG